MGHDLTAELPLDLSTYLIADDRPGGADRPHGRRERGSLRFLDALSPPAVPSHPEEPSRCTRSLLHDQCWLRHRWQVGRSHFVTGPKRVHSRYG